jgi:hypothetical protein
MYRQYEDPHKLEKRLEELMAERERCEDDIDRMYIDESIAELKERINFAWQDDEYDEDYAREYYPEEYAKGEWR